MGVKRLHRLISFFLPPIHLIQLIGKCFECTSDESTDLLDSVLVLVIESDAFATSVTIVFSLHREYRLPPGSF